MNKQFKMKTWLKPLLIGSTLLTTTAATAAIVVSCSGIEIEIGTPSGSLKMFGSCAFSTPSLIESIGFPAGTVPSQILFSLSPYKLLKDGEFVALDKNLEISDYLKTLDKEFANLKTATSPLPDDYQVRIDKYNLMAKSFRYKYVFDDQHSAVFFYRYLKKDFDPNINERAIEYIDYVLETYL